MGTQAELTYLSLRIFHADLDPDQVTKDLGVPPTNAHRKGDSRISKSGRALAPYDTGLWGLSTETISKAQKLDEHLEELFKLIKGKEAIFERYHNNGYRMDVFVFWVMPDSLGGGPLMTWQQAEKLSSFKLDVFFDVY